MKSRLMLPLLALVLLLGGCVSTSGYRSSYGGSSHSVGVGYSYGMPSGYYGYRRTYPGSYGYNGYGDYRDHLYGDGYDRYRYGNSPRYGDYGYRGYPYGVPRYRVIGPGGGYYYGSPYQRPPSYRYRHPGYGYGHPGYGPGHPRVLPPRHGNGRPPWRQGTPRPPVTGIAPPPPPPPPAQPQDNVVPRAESPENRPERGLRRYKGSELPPADE